MCSINKRDGSVPCEWPILKMAVYDEQKRKEFRANNEFCTPFSTIYHRKQTHKKATFALYLALTSRPTLDERASHVYFVRNTNKEYEKQKNSHYDFVCWFDSKSKWTIAKQAVAVLTHFQSFFTFRSFFSLSRLICFDGKCSLCRWCTRHMWNYTHTHTEAFDIPTHLNWA